MPARTTVLVVRFFAFAIVGLLVLGCRRGGEPTEVQQLPAPDPSAAPKARATPYHVEQDREFPKDWSARREGWPCGYLSYREGFLRYHAEGGCDAVFAERIPALGHMIEALRDAYGEGFALETFTMEVAQLDHFQKRLTLAAATSPKWDNKRGKAKGQERFQWGKSHALVVELVNESGALEELQTLFERYAVTVKLQSLEKLFIGQVDELPFGPWLIDQGVSKRAKLPYDAMFWFALEPNEPPQ